MAPPLRMLCWLHFGAHKPSSIDPKTLSGAPCRSLTLPGSPWRFLRSKALPGVPCRSLIGAPSRSSCFLALPCVSWTWRSLTTAAWRALAIPHAPLPDAPYHAPWRSVAFPVTSWRSLAFPAAPWCTLSFPGAPWRSLAIPGDPSRSLALLDRVLVPISRSRPMTIIVFPTEG